MHLQRPAPTHAGRAISPSPLLIMSHKIDLGFHHAALVATMPQRYCCDAPAAAPAAGSPPAMFQRFRPSQGAQVLVRGLPASDDSGLLDDLSSGTGDTGDAIIGDADTEPRPPADDSSLAAAAAAQGCKLAGSTGTGSAVDSMAQALRAHIPSGPLAEDAAMCEGPMGWDLGQQPTSRAPAAAAGEGGGGGSAAGSGAGDEPGRGGKLSDAAAPADDPDGIKRIVQRETLHQEQQQQQEEGSDGGHSDSRAA